MADVAEGIDFVSLTEKAKKISERRSMLAAQEATLRKQIDDIEASLVKDYGADYMAQFNDAVAKINQWEAANAPA